MKGKRGFIENAKVFVKEHRTGIVIAGVGIVGGVLIARNWDWIIRKDISIILSSESKMKTITALDLPDVIKNTIVDAPTKCKIIDYRMFIRNLPKGQRPSIEKVVSAAKNGIELSGNQTWVAPHTKRMCA